MALDLGLDDTTPIRQDPQVNTRKEPQRRRIRAWRGETKISAGRICAEVFRV
jgi:hypothetical protein